MAAGLSESADPGWPGVLGVGVVLEGATGEELVEELSLEFWGRGLRIKMWDLRHRGCRRGGCNRLQPARSPALWEGAGGGDAAVGRL